MQRAVLLHLNSSSRHAITVTANTTLLAALFPLGYTPSSHPQRIFCFYQLFATTRNSSGDEIANVNFFTTTFSTTFTQCIPKATEFDEITQNKGHYAVQGIEGHRFWYQSKVHIRLPISDSILHRFRDIAFDRSKIAIFGYPSCVSTPDGGVTLRRSP